MAEDKVKRNDPCPCGSGLKYKQCHLGREDEVSPEQAKANMVVPAAMSVVGGIGAVAAGMLKGVGAGFTVAIAAGVLIGMFVVLRNPPKGDPDRKDSGSINFGG